MVIKFAGGGDNPTAARLSSPKSAVFPRPPRSPHPLSSPPFSPSGGGEEELAGKRRPIAFRFRILFLVQDPRPHRSTDLMAVRCLPGGRALRRRPAE